LIFFMVLSLLALHQRPAIAHEGGRTYRVVGVEYDDVLNIRAGPSMGYPVVGVIPPGGRGVRLVGHFRDVPRQRNGVGQRNGYYLTLSRLLPVTFAAMSPENRLHRDRASARSCRLLAGDRRGGEGEKPEGARRPSPSAGRARAWPQSAQSKARRRRQKPWCVSSRLSGDRRQWIPEP
jgi:hypothetical protein